MKKLLYISIFFCTKTLAQDSLSVQQYITQFKDIAIAEMQRTGVPAAITLAQGIHESSAGKSELVLRSNNHFGIKCKNTWTGRTVRHDDDASQECFRAYDSAYQSYKDHSDFLRANQRYAFLFGYDASDYSSWAKGLKQAGYATNPRYAPILISMIEKYHLNDYTLLAATQTKPVIFDQITVKQMGVQEQPPMEQPLQVQQVTTSTTNTNPYPTGVFTINNCKVIAAEKGTSLLALAIANKVSLPNIISYNDMDETDILPQSQLIFLEKKQKKGPVVFHQVTTGETLWQISQTEGIRLSNLLQYNQLSFANVPAAGEKIYLQGYAPQIPKLVRR